MNVTVGIRFPKGKKNTAKKLRRGMYRVQDIRYASPLHRSIMLEILTR